MSRWNIQAPEKTGAAFVRVYTNLEGQINFRRRLPIDNLGNPVIYMGVQFRCYTLDVDTVMLREALADFHGCVKCRNIMAEPFRRAIAWLEAKQDDEQRLLSYSVG